MEVKEVVAAASVSSNFVRRQESVSAAACGVAVSEHSFWSEYSIDLESELGAGSFGVVRRGVHLVTGDACAIKCLDDTAEHLVNEARLQEELVHVNVCRLFGYVVDTGKMFMALELCSGGDLDGLLRARAGETCS